ncbi:TIGR03089 family protein [Timonella senegalensis]|uniref:TIGR03089 family protein n=1 Tax=Timonella senegalensis TaxID=1465825 RepID=UPI0002F708A9|nr:TIGR03089 family protein [Timonella senegalensis]
MTSSAQFVAHTLASLMNEPGKPRLTWYGADYERIELSGAVLNNWVNKTTNLLVEEFDAEASIEFALDLPAHWRLIVWTLATLRSGATAHIGPSTSSDVAALITDRPSDKQAPEIVAVSLHALARRFDGELPAGAIDAASAVMTYSDGLGFVSITDETQTALAFPTESISYADLPQWAANTPAASGGRVLIRCNSESPQQLLPLLHNVLGIYSAGGSVIIMGAAAAAEITDDSERFQRIVESERVDTVIELG